MLINPFEDLLSLEEAAEKWDIDPMEIMEAIANEDLIKDIDIKKFNKQWLVTSQGMKRVFGSLVEDPSGTIVANMPYANMRYESYVKNAFGVSREEDPAKLALDYIFDMTDEDEFFFKAKAAASYASYIYNLDILNNYKKFLEENEEVILDTMSQSIGNAKNKIELFDALDRHLSRVDLIYNRKITETI